MQQKSSYGSAINHDNVWRSRLSNTAPSNSTANISGYDRKEYMIGMYTRPDVKANNREYDRKRNARLEIG